MPRSHRSAVLLTGFLLLTTAVTPIATACPFCTDSFAGATLVSDYKSSLLVLYGSLANARLDPNTSVDGGTTDVIIEQELKTHPILDDKSGKVVKTITVDGKQKKVITLPKYLPNKGGKFLFFCDVYKGLIDPVRIFEVQPKSEILAYMQGAIPYLAQPVEKQLRYAFDYLNSEDLDVALEAYKEYQKAAYKDYADMAKELPAEKIVGWLRDPNTPVYRLGLFSSLLGLSGKLEHGEVLRELISDPAKRKSSGIDGMLAGYLLLLKRHGKTDDALSYLQSAVANSKYDFSTRYAIIRVIRFFWQERHDDFGEKALVATMSLALEHHDIADFAIDDLARWQRWEVTDQVLALSKRESHDISVIKRAILRFMLRSPMPQAAAYVQSVRARDPDLVADTQELLKIELKVQQKSQTSQK